MHRLQICPYAHVFMYFYSTTSPNKKMPQKRPTSSVSKGANRLGSFSRTFAEEDFAAECLEGNVGNETMMLGRRCRGSFNENSCEVKLNFGTVCVEFRSNLAQATKRDMTIRPEIKKD